MKELSILFVMLGMNPSPQEVKQLSCMAEAIYFEARSETKIGQLAVGNIILNRVNHNEYPETVCDVVRQGPTHSSGLPVKNRCQFSYYCDGLPERYTDTKAYADVLDTVALLHSGVRVENLQDSLFYHATYVSPAWSKVKVRINKIGSHIFYKE